MTHNDNDMTQVRYCRHRCACVINRDLRNGWHHCAALALCSGPLFYQPESNGLQLEPVFMLKARVCLARGRFAGIFALDHWRVCHSRLLFVRGAWGSVCSWAGRICWNNVDNPKRQPVNRNPCYLRNYSASWHLHHPYCPRGDYAPMEQNASQRRGLLLRWRRRLHVMLQCRSGLRRFGSKLLRSCRSEHCV